MKPEKMKSLSEANLRYCVPKTVKSHFYHCYFTALSTISLYDICKKMNWPQGDFCSGNISIALSSQEKKSNSNNLAHVGFCAPKMSTKILRFCNHYGFWHLINFRINVTDAWFLHPSNIIPSLFYGINLFHIHLIAI